MIWTNERAPLCLRMSELLPNCRTVLGPWSHSWPDCSVPGPNIAYQEECLQFWTEHLKQEEAELVLPAPAQVVAVPGRGRSWTPGQHLAG